MAKRTDGYYNAFLGHGLKNKDPAANFGFNLAPILSDDDLSRLYIGNSIAKKIINLPADESVKNWIEIDGDPDCREKQIIDDLDAESKFADALRWERLYGGSVILLIANDGRTLEDPLNEQRVTEIEGLRVYDKTQVFWNDAVLYEDPQTKQYGQPEYYQLNPIIGAPYMVHESRLLMFKGDPIPDHFRIQRQGWGLPVFQGLWNELLRNDQSHDVAFKVVQRMSQSILKLDGLLDKLSMEGGDEEIKKRLDLIDMARSILNTIAIDKEDDFDLKNMTVTGIPELLDRFGLAVSAAANIPFTLLFGRSPAGMNATGQSDLESYYNSVRQIQRRQLKPNLSRLIQLVSKTKAARKITFNPLWLPSEKEQAETNQANAMAEAQRANAANTYVGMGAADSSEIRRTLAKEGIYEIDLSIVPTDPTPDEINAGGKGDEPPAA